jgi:serine/threonine-protein kinase
MFDAERQGPLEVGQKFLKYTIREQIGCGGHAWVYHGHDSFLDNEVVIKILHRHGGVSEDMLRRARAETKLLFRLKHPNIVEVQDAGLSEEGLLYIVTELLRGKSLRDVLRARGRLPLREALELFLELTQGLEAAHACGAIHRDLKPEKVFILEGGGVKILDFGSAQVVDVAGMTTERDVLNGTILYLSPEQLEGHRATPRSDLYGLGLVFFETLHGRHPLLLNAANPTVRELSLMQIGFCPPRLDELDPSVPRHVARIVERLLMKSPGRRLQSTQELRAALEESLRRIANGSSSAPAEVPAAPGVSSRPPTAPPLTTSVKKSFARRWSLEREASRQRGARALAAGAAVGAGLGVVYLALHVYFSGRDSAVTPPPVTAMVLEHEASTPALAAPEPPRGPAPSPLVAAATIAPPAPALAAETPAPAVSPSDTVPSHTRTLQQKPRRVTNAGKHARNAPNLDDDPHRVWIE